MRATALFVPASAARAAGSGAGAKREAAAGPSGAAKVWAPVLPPYGQDTSMARGWPLRSFLELGAFPGAMPCARLHARAVLWEWGLSIGEDVELVVSEIVTNAVHASRALTQPGVLRLWLLSDRRRVLVMVWDGSRKPPAPSGHNADELREGGWGLLLVETISDRWSRYCVPETGGKVVWALCAGVPAGNR
jgi:anti-sigma regulatory factor (Ser/Thr protein kinase)